MSGGMSLGFIGLGRMGAPMARRLLGQGELHVFDLNAAAVDAVVAEGARRADSIEAIAESCDIAFLSLPSVATVLDTAGRLAGGSRLRTVVDLSTVGPACAIEVADLLSVKGKSFIEAPVSGGVAGAAKGTLALMVSGPEAALAEANAYIARLGRIFDMGTRPGAGQAMKLVNNLMGACAIAITSEGLTLGMKAGLDPERMISVLNASTGRNSATEDKWPKSVLPRTFDFGFATGLCLKDVNLCADMAKTLEVPLQVGGAVQALLTRTAEIFGLESDFTSMALTVEQAAGFDGDIFKK